MSVFPSIKKVKVTSASITIFKHNRYNTKSKFEKEL
jgi:hypothetical protein